MSVKLPETSPHTGQDGQTPVEGVVWLPRARLRSGHGGDRLLAGLAVATVSVIALAAGVATFSRTGLSIGANSASVSSNKASERASAPRPFVANAPVRAAALAPAPAAVRKEAMQQANQEAKQQAMQQAATGSQVQDLLPPQAKAPAPELARETGGASNVRSPAGAAVELAAQAPAPPPAQASARAPAPVTESKPVLDPVPPMPPSAAHAAAPPTIVAAPARAPEPIKAGDPVAASDPPLPPVREARAAPPAPVAQPAAQSAAATPDARVAVYLDEFPDQKAAAAGLSQKSGAYAAHIGSAGKLTYTRRFGDSWRLRVANLDQPTAEALCAKLKGAGAPCVVGPNN